MAIADIKEKEIAGKLEEISGLIHPYKLAYVSPKNDCELLKRNAHYMDKQIFEQLTSNIKEDGFLSQLPFALKQEESGKYLILSGNHRVKAAIKAGLENILIMYVEGISKEKQIAYQLSHNALVGKDDLAMLKEIFEEIKSIEAKEYSGLSDVDFPDFNAGSLPSINEKDIELHEMKFLFTSVRFEQVDKLLEVLEKNGVQPDSARIVNIPFDEFIRVLTAFKKKAKIKSNTVAFLKILDIVEEYVNREENVE